MPGRIRITSGDDAGRVIEVTDEIVIGRRQEGAGKISDIEISRTHARIYEEPDGSLTIEDLGSTNGTFVSGMRITGPRPRGGGGGGGRWGGGGGGGPRPPSPSRSRSRPRRSRSRPRRSRSGRRR